MKKIQTIVVLAVISLVLCACGKNCRNKEYFRKCCGERNTVGDNYRTISHRKRRKKLIIYIHGKDGNATEAEYYKQIFSLLICKTEGIAAVVQRLK